LQVPPEQLPWPAQSDDVLQYGSAGGANTAAGESIVIDAATRDVSAWYAGTGTGAAAGL
jgi:hypothetical protein